MPKGDTLTLKQKRFADKYLEIGNGTQAAVEVYNVSSRESANVIASQNLAKLNLKGYLAEQVAAAKSRIVELSEKARNENVRLQANKDIIDRTEGKAPDTLDLNVKKIILLE